MPTSSAAKAEMTAKRFKSASSPADLKELAQSTRGSRRCKQAKLPRNVVIEHIHRDRSEAVRLSGVFSEARRLDIGNRRVDEQEGASAVRLVPRTDCEEGVRTELGAAVADGREEQPHVRLPGEVQGAPEAREATRCPGALERVHDLGLLLREGDDAGDLCAPVDDAV